MSDASAQGGEGVATETESSTEQPAETLTVEALQAETEKLRAEARKWENRSKQNDEKSKANAAAAAELQKLQREQMSEHEKAVAQAKLEGMSEAKRSLAGQLVSMALRASAAGRLPETVLDKLAATVNAELFLTEDGSVNMEEVSAFVNGIAPKVEDKVEEKPVDPRFPDIGGQGGKGDPTALNGNSLLDAFKAAVGQ